MSASCGRFARTSDGKPLKTAEYEFPTVYDGLRGMQFITRAIEILQRRLALGGAGLKRDIAGVRSARQTASQLTRCCD